MTTLTQNALNDLDRIKNGREETAAPGEANLQAHTFPVDVHETPEAFVLNADLPGVSREDLMVQVVEGRLRISGVRRFPETLHYMRMFELPEAVSGVPVVARLKDGVLTIKLPKLDRMRARRIPVTADPNFTI